MKITNDFKVIENSQSQRTQPDLWDVITGRQRVVTIQGKEKAQEIADRLNQDPYALDRGQTRADIIRNAPNN